MVGLERGGYQREGGEGECRVGRGRGGVQIAGRGSGRKRRVGLGGLREVSKWGLVSLGAPCE